MMNKKQKQILNATLDKALSPPKKRTHLDGLLDEYDDKQTISPPHPTPPHPSSPLITSPQINLHPASNSPSPEEKRHDLQPKQTAKPKHPTAPVRDFNRRAN